MTDEIRPTEAPPRPAAAQQDRSAPHTLPMLLAILNGVNDQIRFADSKAGVIATLHVLLFGFIVTHAYALANVSTPNRSAAFWVASGLLVTYGVATVIAGILVIYSVVSRFGQVAPPSHIFFGHIARRYGASYAKYWQEARGLSEQAWAEEVSGQIVEVSHIALAKHRLVRWASIVTLIVFMLWCAALVATIPLSVG